ncbi:MAG: RluA family pseudouridine synthase [Chloroflexota bacterium]|nr:RluA family pseudouridine synthase [Chloroflexota bacterium]
MTDRAVRKLELVAPAAAARLDKFIADACPDLSRSHVQKLVADGLVTVNGHVAKASVKVSAGDRVVLSIPPPVSPVPLPEAISLRIVYEDADLLVVDKPAGLTVHPAPGHPGHTLVNAVLAHCPELASVGGSMRPGIVHRLDKDTSGLMMVAKNDAALRNLSNQMKARTVTKRYLVLVRGHVSPEAGVIEAPIGRNPRNRKKMAVVAGGREARTHYRVVRYLNGHTLLKVTLETGRTHQIRVHLAATGYPVVGDEVYGGKQRVSGRQFVHSCCLGFRLPATGERVEFSSDLPCDLQQMAARLSVLKEADSR